MNDHIQELIKIYDKSEERAGGTSLSSFEAYLAEKTADDAYTQLQEKGVQLYDPLTLNRISGGSK